MTHYPPFTLQPVDSRQELDPDHWLIMVEGGEHDGEDCWTLLAGRLKREGEEWVIYAPSDAEHSRSADAMTILPAYVASFCEYTSRTFFTRQDTP